MIPNRLVQLVTPNIPLTECLLLFTWKTPTTSGSFHVKFERERIKVRKYEGYRTEK